jgi:hypothetical protein
MLTFIPNRVTPLFQWEEVNGEHFCTAPGAIRLCVYRMADVDKWHFAAWLDDEDGYIHDSNNKMDRSGYRDVEAAKEAATSWGKCPVFVKAGRKAS